MTPTCTRSKLLVNTQEHWIQQSWKESLQSLSWGVWMVTPMELHALQSIPRLSLLSILDQWMERWEKYFQDWLIAFYFLLYIWQKKKCDSRNYCSFPCSWSLVISVHQLDYSTTDYVKYFLKGRNSRFFLNWYDCMIRSNYRSWCLVIAGTRVEFKRAKMCDASASSQRLCERLVFHPRWTELPISWRW